MPDFAGNLKNGVGRVRGGNKAGNADVRVGSVEHADGDVGGPGDGGGPGEGAKAKADGDVGGPGRFRGNRSG
jgi:hypothetical protein